MVFVCFSAKKHGFVCVFWFFVCFFGQKKKMKKKNIMLLILMESLSCILKAPHKKLGGDQYA